MIRRVSDTSLNTVRR